MEVAKFPFVNTFEISSVIISKLVWFMDELAADTFEEIRQHFFSLNEVDSVMSPSIVFSFSKLLG